jgi:hypothetical protein
MVSLMIERNSLCYLSLQKALDFWHCKESNTRFCPNCAHPKGMQLSRTFKNAPPALTFEIIFDNDSHEYEGVKTVSTELQVLVGDVRRTYHLVSVTYFDGQHSFMCYSRTSMGRGFRLYNDDGPHSYDQTSIEPPKGSFYRRPVNAFFILQ